jgi:hypothetical protein
LTVRDTFDARRMAERVQKILDEDDQADGDVFDPR